MRTALILILPAMLAACSGGSNTSTGGDDPNGGGSDASTSKGNGDSGSDGGSLGQTAGDGGAGNPNPTPPSGGESACAQKPYAGDCFDCCDSFHTKGADTYYGTAQTCACRADQCATQCAQTFCAATYAPPKPGDACDLCLGKTLFGANGATPVCSNEAETKCKADPDCVADEACATTAACDKKPDPPSTADGG